jgi:hypothetical protein
MALWLPPDASELLLVTVDSSQAGETEWEGMMLLNAAAVDWLAGDIDSQTYFDLLAAYDIEPEEFIMPVQSKVTSIGP